MCILIVTAVELERDAVLRGLQTGSQIDVITVGVGPIAAAVNTAMKLAITRYDLVINMGIAGGFMNHVEIGSLVVADEVICADLGAETSSSFLSLGELGFGRSQIEMNPSLISQITDAFDSAVTPTTTGPILTVSTTTGTKESAAKLSNRLPQAVTEAMEGFGVASAAQAYCVPFMEIRAISNFVGPRDKTTWRMDEALDTLTTASSVLTKEIPHENRLFTLP
jgi:futalosine hydrolase